MRRALLAAGLAAALIAPPAALAHLGNPNMTSVIRFVNPSVPGVHLQVLGGGDEFELRNQSGKEIVVYGYDGDEYARMFPSGVVQLNKHSPAYYLDQDYYGTIPVPPTASATAKPEWTTVATTAGCSGTTTACTTWAPARRPGSRTRASASGTATTRCPSGSARSRAPSTARSGWSPIHQGGPPVAAIVALVLVALAGTGAAVVVRRRRRRATGGPDAEPTSPEPEREAW